MTICPGHPSKWVAEESDARKGATLAGLDNVRFRIPHDDSVGRVNMGLAYGILSGYLDWRHQKIQSQFCSKWRLNSVSRKGLSRNAIISKRFRMSAQSWNALGGLTLGQTQNSTNPEAGCGRIRCTKERNPCRVGLGLGGCPHVDSVN